MCLNGSNASVKMPRWVGPFASLECIGDVAYRLEQLHPIFHIFSRQCCRKDVYVADKDLKGFTLLAAEKHEGMPYTWIDYGPEHAIWEPKA